MSLRIFPLDRLEGVAVLVGFAEELVPLVGVAQGGHVADHQSGIAPQVESEKRWIVSLR